MKFFLISTALLGAAAAAPAGKAKALASSASSPHPVLGGLRIADSNILGQKAFQIAPDHQAKMQEATLPKKDPLTATHAESPSAEFPDGLAVTVNKPTDGGKAMAQAWQQEAEKVAPNEAAVVAERAQNMAPKIQDTKDERRRLLSEGNKAAAEKVKMPSGSDAMSKIHVEQQLGKEVQKIRGGNTLPPTNTGSVQGPTHFTQSQKPTSFKPGCVNGPNQPGCGPVNDERQRTGEPTTNYVKPADVPAVDKASLAAKDGAAKARQAAAAQAQKPGGTA